MNKKPTLVLLRGVPGSGKTSLANMFVNLGGGNDIAVAADDFFYDEHGDYKWDALRIRPAHEYCQRRVEEILSSAGTGVYPEDVVVYVHNTSTTESEVETYLQIAEKTGADFVSLIVENRHGNENVHSVPNESLAKMENRFSIKLRNTAKTLTHIVTEVFESPAL